MEHGDKDQEEQHVPNPKCSHAIAGNARHKQHNNDNPDPETDQEIVQKDEHPLPETLLFRVLLGPGRRHIGSGSAQSDLQWSHHIGQSRALSLLLALLGQLSKCDPEHEGEDGLHQQVATRQARVLDETNLNQTDSLHLVGKCWE